ncbi:hypothetical protein SAMN05216338_100983 [Bradyrhizobium sp. Rc2d]|nr:hypothetical protein SAMN05216338_100983 [Bradyrhizobium sp. Rc2d]
MRELQFGLYEEWRLQWSNSKSKKATNVDRKPLLRSAARGAVARSPTLWKKSNMLIQALQLKRNYRARRCVLVS